jgi:hypothetical protein
MQLRATRLTAIAHAVRRAVAPAAFTPAILFGTSDQGVWYDPSDFSTLFQDSAGTTPVTALEQPVGLMLDKSKGLVLGPENVSAASSWVPSTNGSTTWTVDVPSSTATVVNSSNSSDDLIIGTLNGSFVGQAFLCTCTINAISGGVVGISSSRATATGARATSGIYQGVIFVTLVGPGALRLDVPGGTTATISNISVRELPGNHATQPTATSRPVVSARVNLLTKTEDFADAVWSKSSATVTANTTGTTDPLGGNTADKALIASGQSVANINQGVSLSAGTYTLSGYVKKAEISLASVNLFLASSGAFFNFDLDTGLEVESGAYGSGFTLIGKSVTPVGDGWYRYFLTATVPAGTIGARKASPYLASGTASGTSGIYIWGADLRVANDGVNLPAYQRVNTATDYDSTGFPVYLRADGVDDGMVTNSINFTATDKMTVVAGVRKLSDAAAGMVAELSVSVNSNAGSFYFDAPEDLNNRYLSIARGVANANTNQSATTGLNGVAPDTAVIAITHDIAGDLSTIRRNTVAGTSGTGDKGTGNFGTYPLYLFRRGGTTAPFNGRFYGMTIVNKLLSTTELTQLETYTNSKTRAFA